MRTTLTFFVSPSTVLAVVSAVAVGLALFLSGCSVQHSQQGSPQMVTQGPSAEDQGTSTNVGSGGTGAMAEWSSVAQTLKDDLRLLGAPPVDEAVFNRIKSELPEWIKNARVEFVDHPLFLGLENCAEQNASQNQAAKKLSPLKDPALERDAINFVDCKLIKVNTRRFVLYDVGSDQMKRLILHEYLGLMGITEIGENGTTTYQISNALIEAFKSIARFADTREILWIKTCKDFESIGHHITVQDYERERNSMLWFPATTWKLAKDLDCSKYQMEPQEQSYVRTLQDNIDGDGHTLIPPPLNKEEVELLDKNWQSKYPIYGNALFSAICANCTIANIKILGASGYGAALIAGINYGTIVNTTVQGSLIANPRLRFEDSVSYYSTDVGGVVVFNRGKMLRMKLDLRIWSDSSVHEATAPDKIYRSVGGAVGSNFGVMASITSETSVTMDKSDIGGFMDFNSGTLRDISAHVRIRSQNPGFNTGGFVASNGNIFPQNIKVWGSIEFPTFSVPRSADVLEPYKTEQKEVNGVVEPQFISGMVGGFQADGAIADAVVDVNICGNITVTQKNGPSYSLLRNPGVVYDLTFRDRGDVLPNMVVLGKVSEKCSVSSDRGLAK